MATFAEMSVPDKIKYAREKRVEGKSVNELFDDVKWKLGQIQGCPISKKAPTKITEKTLVAMCRAFQIECGLIGAGQMKLLGDLRSNYSICSVCSVGQAVREYKRININEISPDISVVDEKEWEGYERSDKSRTHWTKKTIFKVRLLFQRGETLKSIAHKVHIPVNEIVRMVT